MEAVRLRSLNKSHLGVIRSCFSPEDLYQGVETLRRGPRTRPSRDDGPEVDIVVSPNRHD